MLFGETINLTAGTWVTIYDPAVDGARRTMMVKASGGQLHVRSFPTGTTPPTYSTTPSGNFNISNAVPLDDGDVMAFNAPPPGTQVTIQVTAAPTVTVAKARWYPAAV